jgi:hypothetical protein
MTALLYLIPVDDLSFAIRTAFDMQTTSGIQPKIIIHEEESVKYNNQDAYRFISGNMEVSQYIEKHRI